MQTLPVKADAEIVSHTASDLLEKMAKSCAREIAELQGGREQNSGDKGIPERLTGCNRQDEGAAKA